MYTIIKVYLPDAAQTATMQLHAFGPFNESEVDCRFAQVIQSTIDNEILLEELDAETMVETLKQIEQDATRSRRAWRFSDDTDQVWQVQAVAIETVDEENFDQLIDAADTMLATAGEDVIGEAEYELIAEGGQTTVDAVVDFIRSDRALRGEMGIPSGSI
jgi:hypothetical protein